MEKKTGHLPVVGIGPLLCLPVVVLTAAGVTASAFGIIPCAVENGAAKTVMLVIGILFIVIGIALFFGADAGGKLKDQIEQNKLKTNGSYRFVRNPCYSLFLLASTGAVLIAHNPLLLVIPLLYWLEMTVVLKRTEEKWLTELYGQQYTDYCKRVNRCIPWFERK